MTIYSTFTFLAFGALLVTSAAANQPAITPSTVRFNTCSKPEWPKQALQRRDTGTVTLKFLIDEEGKVIDSIVRKSSGSADLDEAARRGLARCKLTPARHNGHPIQTWSQMQYVWTLNDKKAADIVEEANALRVAGAKGDMEALFKLSKIYTAGSGIKPDLAAAATLLELAANNKHPQAALILAQQYEFGTQGRTKDAAQAGSWYLKAAELGVAQAQHKIGASLLGAEDAAQGAAWLRKAADQDFPAAAYDLARALASGKVVARDPGESLRLLRSAAAKDHTKAQHALAVALLRGEGTPADAAEAVRWLEIAAQDHQGDAELLLAELKLEGKDISRDEAGGAQLLRRAAAGGNIPAMSVLGTLLARGLVTPADPGESTRWLDKAARYGAGEPPYGTGYFRQLMASR